jgi:multiple sugar transport system ATP-binding protein
MRLAKDLKLSLEGYPNVFADRAVKSFKDARDRNCVAGAEERAARVLDAAKLLDLDLEPDLDGKPEAFSGGQRQRVARGHTIVREPQVFLMDEALSNVNAQLRVQTSTQIASLQRRLAVSTVCVAHDQTEALTTGHRIAVLNDGLIQQVGTPCDLFNLDAHKFVAGFICSPAMHIFLTKAIVGGLELGTMTAAVDAKIMKLVTGDVFVGIRPEDLVLATDGKSL